MEDQLTEDEAYDVLGLGSGAEPNQVDAAHRRLASRAHPDRWLGADADEQETVRGRFEEVNEAYRLLKAARKAGLGPTPGGSGPSGPRPRAAPVAAPRPAAADVVHPAPSEFPDVEDDPVRRIPPGLVAAVLVAAAVMALVAFIGLSSPSADGSRQRSVLGPLAHQLWEAERVGDHGAMWDLAEDSFKTSVDRADFVSKLNTCPHRRPPREVARIDSASGGLWEVESIDPAGFSGLSYFRQEDTYRFGAVLDDPDLQDLLAGTVETAAAQRWCQRQ